MVWKKVSASWLYLPCFACLCFLPSISDHLLLNIPSLVNWAGRDLFKSCADWTNPKLSSHSHPPHHQSLPAVSSLIFQSVMCSLSLGSKTWSGAAHGTQQIHFLITSCPFFSLNVQAFWLHPALTGLFFSLMWITETLLSLCQTNPGSWHGFPRISIC